MHSPAVITDRCWRAAPKRRSALRHVAPLAFDTYNAPMPLRDTLARVRQALPAGQYVNEAAVSLGVVIPILADLGWPVYDPMVVAPEFTLENRRVDFALCHPRSKPAVFIEVKQPGKSEGADRQLFEYAFHLGIPLAVLTDGREWHFYLPAAQGEYQERRVYKLDLIERPIAESEARLARYLTYSAVTSGVAQRAAQDDYAGLRKDREIAETVPRAWRQLLEEQDELLVDLLADQVETLCGFKPDPDVVTRFLAGEAGAFAARPTHASPAPRPPGRVGPRPEPAARGTPVPQMSATARAGTPVDAGATANTLGASATGFVLGGQATPTRNAKDTLVRFFEAMAGRDPTFLTRFAALPRHGRRRRFLASDRNALYPERTDLAAEYAHEVVPGWWLGTNYSAQQIAKIIGMACEVAGLDPTHDVQVRLSA